MSETPSSVLCRKKKTFTKQPIRVRLAELLAEGKRTDPLQTLTCDSVVSK